MSIVVATGNGTSGGTNTLAIAISPPLTAGNIVVVKVTGSVNNVPAGTPTAAGVSGWVPLGSSNGGPNTHVEVWAGLVVTGGATSVSVVHPSSSSTFRGVYFESNGSTLVGGFGTPNLNTNTANPVTASISPTLGAAGIAFAAASASSGTLSLPTNSFTPITGANTVHAYSYRIYASAPSSIATGWSVSPTIQSEDTVIAWLYDAAPSSAPLFLPESLGLSSLTGIH